MSKQPTRTTVYFTEDDKAVLMDIQEMSGIANQTDAIRHSLRLAKMFYSLFSSEKLAPLLALLVK